jgi:hypothetical protein
VGPWSLSTQIVLLIPLGMRGGQLFSRTDTIMYLCLCCLHRNLLIINGIYMNKFSSQMNHTKNQRKTKELHLTHASSTI